MVNLSGVPIALGSLTEGRSQGVLLFKVDRIYFPEVIHYMAGRKRLKEMLFVDLIVFDRSVSYEFLFLSSFCMLMVSDNVIVIDIVIFLGKTQLWQGRMSYQCVLIDLCILEKCVARLLIFMVIKNEGQYRASNHPFKVIFTLRTHVFVRKFFHWLPNYLLDSQWCSPYQERG